MIEHGHDIWFKGEIVTCLTEVDAQDSMLDRPPESVGSS